MVNIVNLIGPRLIIKILLLVSMIGLTGCSILAQDDTSKDKGIFGIVNRADQAYLEGRWIEAEKLYASVTQKVPEDFYAWYRLANVQLKQGRVETAIYTYGEALKRNPNHAKGNYNLAVAHLLSALQQMELAEESMREHDPGKKIVQSQKRKLIELLEAPLSAPEKTEKNPGGYSSAFTPKVYLRQ